MDSQMQLAEHNNEFSDVSSPEAVAGTDTGMASNPDPLTDQAIADSIQTSLQSETLSSELGSQPTVANQLSTFSTQLAGFWREFSQSSRPFLVSFAWVLVTLVALKILASVVSAVNSIPLLAPLFQLIGVGYAVWFTNRYLLKRSTRQELSQKIKNFTGQAFDQSSDSDLAITVANSDLAVSNTTAGEPAMLEE
jgi:hypothetical protein